MKSCSVLFTNSRIMTQTEIKEKVLQGGKLAIERMLVKKRQTNSYIVVSGNGKIVKVKP